MKNTGWLAVGWFAYLVLFLWAPEARGQEERDPDFLEVYFPHPDRDYTLPPGPMRELLVGAAAEAEILKWRHWVPVFPKGLKSPFGCDDAVSCLTWNGIGSLPRSEATSGWDDSFNWERWRFYLKPIGAPPFGAFPPEEDAFEPAWYLALIAKATGRDLDVWHNLERLDAGVVDDLLPALLLDWCTYTLQKIPPASERDQDNPIYPLLPPLPVWDRSAWEGPAPRRRYRVGHLALFDTTFAMSVEVTADRVEVELEHQSGPALVLHVHLPTPEGYTKVAEWVGGQEVEGLDVVRPVQLEPSGKPIKLAATLRASAEVPLDLDAILSIGPKRGIALETTAQDPRRGMVESFAMAMGQLLDVPVSCLIAGAEGARTDGTRLVIDLRPGSRRHARLLSLMSQVERRVLAKRAARR